MNDVVLLAGGGSTRVFGNKALLSINGILIIQRIIGVINEVAERIILVLKERSDNAGILKLVEKNVKNVFEDYAFWNPLAGIYAGLRYSTRSMLSYCLVIHPSSVKRQ